MRPTARTLRKVVSYALKTSALSSALAIIGMPATAVTATAAVISTTQTNVTFHGYGGLVLHGTIVAPAAPGRYPGVVMIGGSGPQKRSEFSSEAAAFAERGIVTLIYDKRTSGYSVFHRNYSVLARDAIGGVELLRSQLDIEPGDVGVFGLSEGGWVAPLAATMTTDIAFVVTAGAAGMTPAQQTAWQYSEWLQHAGVTGSLLQTMQTGTSVLVALGLFPEANFNVIPVWQIVRQPVLAIWGDMDRQSAPALSAPMIEHALQQGGNDHYTIRFLVGAQHDLHITRNDGFDHLTTLAPGYTGTVSSWVRSLSHRPPSASRSVIPKQARQEVPLAKLASLKWYDASSVQVIAFFLLLAVFGCYPVVALIRRIRHRSAATQIRKSMRWVATTGFISVFGFFAYFLFLALTGATVTGPVIFGNPVPWMILRAFSLAAVVSTIWTAIEWYRRRGKINDGRFQASFVVASGLIFAIWAGYWGLLIR